MQVTYLMLVYSVFKVREGRSNKSLYLTTPPNKPRKRQILLKTAQKTSLREKMSKKRAEPYGMRMNSAVGEMGVLACQICSEKMDFVREHRK